MTDVVLLLGEQGSGKGTVGRHLSESLGGRFISAGDLLRAEAGRGTSRGVAIAERIDEGFGVPTEISYGLLREAIEDAVGEDLLFLDGYPRKLDQVDLLAQTVRREPDLVLVLHVPTVITVARLLSRLTCTSCGRVYGPHVPPQAAMVCDACGQRLEHRDDDNDQGIKRRHTFWRRHGRAVVRRYERMGLVEHIDATGMPEVVRDIALERINRS